MLRVKKSGLIILLVLTLILGATIPLWLQVFDVVDLSRFSLKKRNVSGLAPEIGDAVLSGDEYEDYQYLLATYGKLDSLRQLICSNYYTEVDTDALDTWTYKGLLAGLNDPYSAYYTAEEYASLLISTTGEYSGIGVTITAGDSGYIEVVSPTDDTPAYKAGIKTGDYIVKINGEEYYASDLDMAAATMRGEPGTDVTVTILRGDELFDLTLTRETIINVTVKYEMLEDQIGYIRISSFEENTAKDFQAALLDLESSGAEHLVIDIRDNGGGMVDSSIEIADLLMDKGTVVYAEDHNGKKTYYSTGEGRTDLKYAILINGGSASASEILSCGVQDNGEGIIVGTQSYGKGIIQALEKLPDGSAVKITILQYFSPSGNVIHKQGVTPDHVVELTDDCYDEYGNLVNDLQLQKAIELLKQSH